MATIPTIPSESPGNFWTSALWNANVLNGLNYLLSPVRFKGYAVAAQSLTSSTSTTVLALDTTAVDSDNGHSNVTNNSRYTCQTAGLFYVSGSVNFAQNSGGTRTLQVFQNGASITGSAVQAMPSATNGASVFTSTIVQLSVGDYVELAAWQNSGSTLATATSNALLTTMCLWRLSS